MIPKPSPANDYPFTGYRYHKKETNLAALWKSFTDSQKQAEDFKKSLYRNYQPVPQSYQDRGVVKEEIKNESI